MKRKSKTILDKQFLLTLELDDYRDEKRMRVGNGDAQTQQAYGGCPTTVPQHPRPSFTGRDTSRVGQVNNRTYPDPVLGKETAP
jgi:hypothetical protein